MRFVTRSKRGGVPASSRGSKISCWAAIRSIETVYCASCCLPNGICSGGTSSPSNSKRIASVSSRTVRLVAELWNVWQGAGDETLSLWRPVSFASGRYHLQSRLGEGGQKRVFLARDKELDRDVVIGVLNRRQIESDSLNRLRREAKAMARLDEHPNVVSVYDIGEEDGNPFIVTQYVRGGSVADVLSACRPAPLQLPEAIRIAAQTCRALNHARAGSCIAT